MTDRASTPASPDQPQTPARTRPPEVNLEPARWIWYPSQRTLPNTFVLFRRGLDLPASARSVRGWIFADSRYQLLVNGRRVQWGPAPCDPRFIEIDPVDLAAWLKPGPNVIGVQVLFYGIGEGTWPVGKPGLILKLDIEHHDGRHETLVTDENWQAHLARAWPPGQHKRWYLRALQEEFDARRFPFGWCEADAWADASSDATWRPAMLVPNDANNPPVCSRYADYMFDANGDPTACTVRPRTIPMMREVEVGGARLAESLWIDWCCDPVEYFQFLPDDSFAVDRSGSACRMAPGRWVVDLPADRPSRAAALTFAFDEQIVGWPRFTIEAPVGTVVEMMVHEAHSVGGRPLLNTHWHSWSRFICQEGVNTFEPFDFESFRWVQLHIRNAAGRVVVSDVAARRRLFPWPEQSAITIDEPPLQRLMDAAVNTLHNCAQETLVDGMARERQQYSGDVSHQIHAIYPAFGETRLPARFVRTYSQGMTCEGYFLDCWPAYDRLNRVTGRMIGLAPWGPILDHGVGFIFDCYHHYLYTGDRDAVAEAWPRIARFAAYLQGIRGKDGLLPVEGLGIPCVWIDHEGYLKQRHKQCAFNLYVAGMFKGPFASLCATFGHEDQARAARKWATELEAATVERFWSPTQRLFVDNLPWLDEEQTPRTHDRTLAMAVLFGQCPKGVVIPAVETMIQCPPTMGFSYPANAGWRLWALGEAGRPEVVVDELRRRWATMDSVQLNNTLSEDWHPTPDSGSEWSHCPVAPLYVLYMTLLGIRPQAPGFERYVIQPRCAPLPDFDVTAQTVHGPLRMRLVTQTQRKRALTLETPAQGSGTLLLPSDLEVDLSRSSEPAPAGLNRYVLPRGSTMTVPEPRSSPGA